MSRKVCLSLLLIVAVAFSTATSALAKFSTGPDTQKTEKDKKKDQKEIGSDKQSGGPTQGDRDAMDKIKENTEKLKNKKQKEQNDKKHKKHKKHKKDN